MNKKNTDFQKNDLKKIKKFKEKFSLKTFFSKKWLLGSTITSIVFSSMIVLSQAPSKNYESFTDILSSVIVTLMLSVILLPATYFVGLGIFGIFYLLIFGAFLVKSGFKNKQKSHIFIGIYIFILVIVAFVYAFNKDK